MLCPKCGHRLLRKSADKRLRLRVPIVVFDEEGQEAKTSCPACKEEIPLPISLEKSAIPDETPLVLSKGLLAKTPLDSNS